MAEFYRSVAHRWSVCGRRFWLVRRDLVRHSFRRPLETPDHRNRRVLGSALLSIGSGDPTPSLHDSSSLCGPRFGRSSVEPARIPPSCCAFRRADFASCRSAQPAGMGTRVCAGLAEMGGKQGRCLGDSHPSEAAGQRWRPGRILTSPPRCARAPCGVTHNVGVAAHGVLAPSLSGAGQSIQPRRLICVGFLSSRPTVCFQAGRFCAKPL